MDFWKQLAKESRFSRAARPCDNHRGEMSGRLSDLIIQISRYVSHVSILRLYFRMINNKAFAFRPEAATIRSRDLDQEIISSHIRRMRDQVADEIRRFIHERSAPTADGAMIADVAAHSLATAVFASLETWMSKGGEDIDELSRLTDIALRALEDGLTHTLREAGLD